MNEKKLNYPKGYKAWGLHCGIKKSNNSDITVIYSESKANVASVFTSNKVQAAPVLISKEHLLKNNNEIQGIIISSGNANAATGQNGKDIARKMCSAVANSIECETNEILIAQTGLIGIPLEESIAVKGSTLVTEKAKVGEVSEGWLEASKGIMTTDTYNKIASREINLNGKKIVILGISKGVAMMSPSMATMICVFSTDACITKECLNEVLLDAVNDSFHQLCIDGCMSTNDTVFLLANQVADNQIIENNDCSEYMLFRDALRSLAIELATLMAKDAEGISKYIHVKVVNAKSKKDAQIIAKKIVGSVLVKCAIAGECAYWGRVIAEVGASGVEIDPDHISIYFGDVQNCEYGMAKKHDIEKIKKYMHNKEIQITVDLNLGTCAGESFGSDLTHEYVTINMEKS